MCNENVAHESLSTMLVQSKEQMFPSPGLLGNISSVVFKGVLLLTLMSKFVRASADSTVCGDCVSVYEMIVGLFLGLQDKLSFA